jgi:hypothetical protein
VPLLAEGDVRVVFSGHVHNFQITREETEGSLKQTRYLVTGAGGKDERGREGTSGLEILRRERMEATNAVSLPHFLLIEIEGDRMEVTPLTYGAGGNLPVPLAIRTSEDVVHTGNRESISGGGAGNGGSNGPSSPYHPITIRARPR